MGIFEELTDELWIAPCSSAPQSQLSCPLPALLATDATQMRSSEGMIGEMGEAISIVPMS